MPKTHPIFEAKREELIYSGHSACPGCASPLIMRNVLNVLGQRTVVCITACCWSGVSGGSPYTALKVPVLHTPFATAGATATGIKWGLDAQGQGDVSVLAWAGDGGTFDIGLQSLSGAMERNEDIIYVCYDNEAYMNTGIQRSSATPKGAWTTTTPLASTEKRPKKNLIEIAAAHGIPYAATVTVAYLEDLVMKVEKAKKIKGAKLLHALSPCPPGWRSDTGATIQISRLAVQSRVFPLYEVENGNYRLTVEPEKVPVSEYLATQGRFKHLSQEELNAVQENVDSAWETLLWKCWR